MPTTGTLTINLNSNFGGSPLALSLSWVKRKLAKCEKKRRRELQGFRGMGKGIEIPYATLFPLRILNPNPMKTRNPAPARNYNSCFPPQFWAQIPNITAKKCRIPHPAKPIGDPQIGRSLPIVFQQNWPLKFPRNWPFFPRICPWKFREIWLFFRNLPEAL